MSEKTFYIVKDDENKLLAIKTNNQNNKRNM